MLKTNFVKSNPETVNFAKAVKCAYHSMSILAIDDKIATIDKKITNTKGNYTNEQIEGFKAEKKELEKDKKAFEKARKEVESVYKTVVSRMKSTKTKDGFNNPENAVKNLINIIATAENPKLLKYAIIDKIDSELLFMALEKCHDIEITIDGGKASMTNDVKAAYNTAENEIANIIRKFLSLPVETTYTTPVRVRLNKNDLRLIHECYVTGFTNDFSLEEDGSVKFNGRNVKTLISTKKNKDGKVTRNFTKFAELLGKIMIAKISEK